MNSNGSPKRTFIESDCNTKFKVWARLSHGKEIKKEGIFLVHGQKIVQEVLKKFPESVEGVLLPKGHWDKNNTFSNVKSHFELAPKLFHEVDFPGTQSPILVVKNRELPTWNIEKEKSKLNVFLPLSDPNNLGSAIRTATALGAEKIILLKEAANPFHYRTIRASAGASLISPLERGPSIQELSGDFVSLDMNGRSLSEFEWPKVTNLLLGEEGQGIPQSLKRRSISIPIHSEVESLNASAALSIALYSWSLSNSK